MFRKFHPIPLKINIPENLKLLLCNKFKININDFYFQEYFYDDSFGDKISYIDMYFNNFMNRSFEMTSLQELIKLFNLIFSEIAYTLNPKSQSQSQSQSQVQMQKLVQKNHFLVINSRDFKEIMVVQKSIILIITQDYMLFVPTNNSNTSELLESYTFIFNKQIYFKFQDKIMNCKFKQENFESISNSIGYGFIKDKNIQELFNFKINNNFEIEQNIQYQNMENNITIKSYDYLNTKIKQL